MPTILAQSVDPRAGSLQPAAHPDLEYRSAVPLGPWYQMSPWAWTDLPQESFYSPRGSMFPPINPFIPRRTGAYIQPSDLSSSAYKLQFESGQLDGLGQVQSGENTKAIKFAVGTWIGLGVLRAVVNEVLPPRKVRKLVRGTSAKGWALFGLVVAGGFTYWFMTRRERLPELEVSMFGLGQANPWAVEDPTGGQYFLDPDTEMFGPGLGPGENIAVASVAYGSLKPRGFATTTVP